MPLSRCSLSGTRSQESGVSGHEFMAVSDSWMPAAKVLASGLSIPFYWRCDASQSRRAGENDDKSAIWAKKTGAVGSADAWPGACQWLLEHADRIDAAP